MSVVVIGNFDGVHKGHQSVLAQAHREDGSEVIVLTFDPHPAEVLGRARPPRLTTLERRVELLSKHGADRVVVEPFTTQLAAQLPAQFAEELLGERFAAKAVVVGSNFRFGKDRAGDLATLDFLGRTLGFRAVSAVVAGDAEGPFSSTRAREAVVRGDLAAAELVLGRPHSLSGVVVHGNHVGRTIGFPTANLDGVEELMPPNGVYAVLVDRDGTRLAKGVMNVGVRPTVSGEATIRVEPHLLDFDGDLYGQTLRIHLVKHLRDERKMGGLDELKAQIAKDSAAARDALKV